MVRFWRLQHGNVRSASPFSWSHAQTVLILVLGLNWKTHGNKDWLIWGEGYSRTLFMYSALSAQELRGSCRLCPSTKVLPLALTPMQWDGKVKPCPWHSSAPDMEEDAEPWGKAALCQPATDKKTVKTFSLCSPLGSTVPSSLPEQDLFINTHRCARARAEGESWLGRNQTPTRVWTG